MVGVVVLVEEDFGDEEEGDVVVVPVDVLERSEPIELEEDKGTAETIGAAESVLACASVEDVLSTTRTGVRGAPELSSEFSGAGWLALLALSS